MLVEFLRSTVVPYPRQILLRHAEKLVKAFSDLRSFGIRQKAESNHKENSELELSHNSCECLDATQFSQAPSMDHTALAVYCT